MQSMHLEPHETIRIGDDILLTFLGISRGKIHLRITTGQPVRPSSAPSHGRKGSTLALVPVPRKRQRGDD